MNIARFSVKYFEEILSGTCMTLMFIATFANVVARYFFNQPIMWAEEFSRYAFIWVVFLGAVICTKRKRHIAIESLVQIMPREVQPFFHLSVDLLIMSLMAVIFYYGWLLTFSATQITATLNVPQYVVYFVVPVSAGLIFLYSLGDLRHHLRTVLSGQEKP
jgi:TRAP-type C4-dicarboxylate transport system permease small subunit